MTQRSKLVGGWKFHSTLSVISVSCAGLVLAQSAGVMEMWQERTRQRIEALDPGAILAMACTRLSDADSTLNEAFRAYMAPAAEGFFAALNQAEVTLSEANGLLQKSAETSPPKLWESALGLPFFQVEGARPDTPEEVVMWMQFGVSSMLEVLGQIGDTGEGGESFGQVLQTSAELRQLCAALTGLRTDALRTVFQ